MLGSAPRQREQADPHHVRPRAAGGSGLRPRTTQGGSRAQYMRQRNRNRLIGLAALGWLTLGTPIHRIGAGATVPAARQNHHLHPRSAERYRELPKDLRLAYNQRLGGRTA